MTEPIPPGEMTLDELREHLAPRLPAHAAFDGWGEAALTMAAQDVGVPADRVRLCFPDGPVQMIDAWFDSVDVRMAQAFPLERIAPLKIRERVRDLVLFRIDLLRADKEALRRAHATLALPKNAMAGARLAWRSADRMWRIAGDRATDFNYYSKRGILSALYASTMLVFLDDESEDLAATCGFLDRRIDDVMKIEKLKASWRGGRERRPSLSRFLGRLRYPVV